MGERLDAIFPNNRNVVLTNYGRTAFEKILQIENLFGATILFPALLWSDLFERLIDEYNLEPVFVDVDSRYYHPDVEHVNRIIDDVDAVVLNHTFGVPADVREWQAIANRCDVVLIEDCARGLGAVVDGRLVGSFGDYAIYSLKKVTPAVRGGALAGTVDPSRIDLEPPKYDVKNAYPLLPDVVESRAVELYQKTTGNCKSSEEDRASSTQSEYHPLSPELRELDGINQLVFFHHVFREFRRRVTKHARFQRRIQRSLTEFDVTFQQTRGTCPFHFLGLMVPDGRDVIVERMRNAGLAPRMLWNPPLVSRFVEESRLGEYPNTKTVVENGIQLPLVKMDDNEVEKAIASIRRALQRRAVGGSSV